MATASGASTPLARSRSRSKRSSTNLADLRLAPLSTKYEASQGEGPPLKTASRTPYENAESSADYARRHSSYIVGQSAPTTPGILSRSNSKRHVGGGLSRRGSLYDDAEDGDADAENENTAPVYGAVGPARRGSSATGQLSTKAKSEAALLANQPHAGRANRNSYRGRRSGAATPTQKRQADSWLTHTGAITSALVREDKGQSYITTRQSATSLAPETTDDDDDEEEDNYETMAQLAASTQTMRNNSYGGYSGAQSPVSTRQRQGSAWGSRYGSRTQSRRTSRINSPVGTRTPGKTAEQGGGYFDVAPMSEGPPSRARHEERGTDDDDDDDDDDDEASLAPADGFGLGQVVDRVMNFNLFGSNEGAETTDDEVALRENETAEEARKRMEVEKERRRLEKDKLTKQAGPAPVSGDGEGGAEVNAGWQDASWLLSVAAKALF